jgi:uncharacterized protein YndB with AHSA1/START domain
MSSDRRFEHVGRVAQAEITTAAPPDRVWQAWADPERLSEWFTDRAEGVAREGATFTWHFDRFNIALPYDVLLAEPERHLVMRGTIPGRPAYVQEVRIEPAGTGSFVRVASSGYSRGEENDEEYEGVVSGWRIALAILRHYLEHHFGEPRRSFFAMQPARFEYARIRRFFTEQWYLGRWLTSTGSLAPPGERFRLELRGGDTMTGSVLAVTSHEVALSWEEINGVLEMKAFRLGPQTRAVGLRGCGWLMSAEMRLELEQMANRFVKKLVAALDEPSTPRSGNGHGAGAR